MDIKSLARQMRKSMQLVALQQTDEGTILSLAGLFPTFNDLLESKKEYPAGTIFSYGKTDSGEIQLYSFISNYTPVDTYTPNEDATHYKKFGLSDSGYPIWVQPLGASDAYSKYDAVFFENKLWVSIVDNNVWQPGVYGWEEKTE